MRTPNDLGIPINRYVFINKFLKLLILPPPKKMRISKNSIKFTIIFFQKEIIWHTYIRTKCNDNFKFFISLK